MPTSSGISFAGGSDGTSLDQPGASLAHPCRTQRRDTALMPRPHKFRHRFYSPAGTGASSRSAWAMSAGSRVLSLPAMKSSVICRAMSSWYCTGGLFMK